MKLSAITTDKDPGDENNVKERDDDASDFRSSQRNNIPYSLPQQHATEVAIDVVGSLANSQEQHRVASNNGDERDHDGINHDEDHQIDSINSSSSCNGNNNSNEINSNNNDNHRNAINNDSDYTNQCQDDEKFSADDDTESDEDSDTNDSSGTSDYSLNHEQHPDHENNKNGNHMLSSIDRSDESYPLPGSQLHSIQVRDSLDSIISKKHDNQQRQLSSVPSAVENGTATLPTINHHSKPGTSGHFRDAEQSEMQKNAMMKAVNVVQPLSSMDGPTYKDQVSRRRRDILQEQRQQQPNQPHQEQQQQKQPPEQEQRKAAKMMKQEQQDQRKEPLSSTLRSGISNDSDNEKNQEKNLRHRIDMITRNDIDRHDESHFVSHRTSLQQQDQNDVERGHADGSMEKPQVVVLEAFVVDSIIVDAEPMPAPNVKGSHTSRHNHRESSEGDVIYEVDDDASSKEDNSDDDDNYRPCCSCCYRGHHRRNPRIQHVRVDVRWYRLLFYVFMFVVVCIVALIASHIYSAIFG